MHLEHIPETETQRSLWKKGWRDCQSQEIRECSETVSPKNGRSCTRKSSWALMHKHDLIRITSKTCCCRWGGRTQEFSTHHRELLTTKECWKREKWLSQGKRMSVGYPVPNDQPKITYLEVTSYSFVTVFFFTLLQLQIWKNIYIYIHILIKCKLCILIVCTLL